MSTLSSSYPSDLLARINPEMWDIIRQIETRISAGTRLVMSSMLVKSIAMETPDENTKSELNQVGKALFNSGLKAMSYEDDIWYCGTPYPHLPFSNNLSVTYRRDEEEREKLIAWLLHFHTGDPQLYNHWRGNLLISLSNSIPSKELSNRLSQIGHQMNEQNIR